jgi:flavin-dependent dehydrogenase
MPGSQHLGPLPEGGTVAVIGGGPGGAAAAIALKRGARALGRTIQVELVEGKQFSGERHHNQCSGVLSPPIADILEQELGIPFPHHLTQRTITGYVLHTPRRQVVLDGEDEPSSALRRIQFDEYMLEAARQQAVEITQARVTELEFHPDRVVVYTESSQVNADVVVGAFGLDEGTASLFHRAVGYQPPPSLSSVVTNYHPGDAFMASFGSRIHAFLPSTPGIEFGAVTPKGNHLTINIAGRAADANLMDAFLSFPEVIRVLPYLELAVRSNHDDLCFFKGRFPGGLAHRFTGDRFVMVGDAAGLVRAFKGKGVTSAIQTGIRAAQVILREGISAGAFQVYHTANRDILEDLPYGRFMRILTIAASRFGWMDFALAAAGTDPGLRQALFDAVSGHRPYRSVVRSSLSLGTLAALIRALKAEMGRSSTPRRL